MQVDAERGDAGGAAAWDGELETLLRLVHLDQVDLLDVVGGRGRGTLLLLLLLLLLFFK